MNELETWLTWYTDNGLTYFPLFGILNGACRCGKGAGCGANAGKHPKVKHWKNMPSQKVGALDNVAISTDPLIVVDLDGDVGESALADFPPTFTTSTGHGYHLWYKANPVKSIKSIVGWKPKVDIRAIGGLLVVPPSRHRNGGTYRHVRGDSIQNVPMWLLDELPERQERVRKVGHTVVPELDHTHEILRPLGERLVAEMLDFDVQKGRNSTLFRLSCRYFEMAEANLLGTDVLAELVDAAVRTGLTPTEIERTIQSASNSV